MPFKKGKGKTARAAGPSASSPQQPPQQSSSPKRQSEDNNREATDAPSPKGTPKRAARRKKSFIDQINSATRTIGAIMSAPQSRRGSTSKSNDEPRHVSAGDKPRKDKDGNDRKVSFGLDALKESSDNSNEADEASGDEQARKASGGKAKRNDDVKEPHIGEEGVLHFLDHAAVPGIPGSDDEGEPTFMMENGLKARVHKWKPPHPIAQDTWSRPSEAQMIDSLKVSLMMSRNALEPLPASTKDYVNILVDNYGKKQQEVDKAKAALKKNIERFRDVSDEWKAREQQYKDEIRRLEKLLARESKDGTETVLIARQHSVVDRTDTRRFTATIDEAAAGMDSTATTVGIGGDGAAQDVAAPTAAPITAPTTLMVDAMAKLILDPYGVKLPEEDDESGPPVPRSGPAFMLDPDNDKRQSDMMRAKGARDTDAMIQPGQKPRDKKAGPTIQVLAAQERATEKAKEEAIARERRINKLLDDQERATGRPPNQEDVERAKVMALLQHTNTRLEEVAQNQESSSPAGPSDTKGKGKAKNDMQVAFDENTARARANDPGPSRPAADSEDDLTLEREQIASRIPTRLRVATRDRPVDSSSSSDSSCVGSEYRGTSRRSRNQAGAQSGTQSEDTATFIARISAEQDAAEQRLAALAAEIAEMDDKDDDEEESDEGPQEIGDCTVIRDEPVVTEDTTEPKVSDDTNPRPFSFLPGQDTITTRPVIRYTPMGIPTVVQVPVGENAPLTQMARQDENNQGLAPGPSSEGPESGVVATTARDTRQQTLISPATPDVPAMTPVAPVTAPVNAGGAADRRSAMAAAATAAGLDQWVCDDDEDEEDIYNA